MEGRVSPGQRRVLRKQRGRLVVQGRCGREDPLGDPPVDIARPVGQVEVDQCGIEVVLIGSDSLDTVGRTHANNFDGIGSG